MSPWPGMPDEPGICAVCVPTPALNDVPVVSFCVRSRRYVWSLTLVWPNDPRMFGTSFGSNVFLARRTARLACSAVSFSAIMRSFLTSASRTAWPRVRRVGPWAERPALIVMTVSKEATNQHTYGLREHFMGALQSGCRLFKSLTPSPSYL